MSRCFPFPPPGYEKKARTDDVDLLNKEKQKEKSHKKEKKEKREKKEKKEKDRSDGKHKDKKDKKEKHKDKDKKKEKSRDKEKEKERSNNSEEKKFPGQPDGQNGEKTSDEKKFLEKPEGHSGEKFIQKEKGRDKDRSSFSSEKNFAGHISSFNREKIGQNSHPAQGFRDSKFVQELAGRVRDEGAGAASQLADKSMGTNRKRDEGMVGFVAKTAHKPAEEKEKSKRSDDRRFDVQGIKEETRAGGNAMVPNLAGAVKAKVEGIPKQVENNTEKRGEGKEKVKEKEGDNKTKDRHKDKDREKKSHGKDKDRDKAKEEKAKAKAKGEHRNLELDNLKGSNKDGPGGNINLKTSHPSKDGNKGVVAEENLRKRKDLEKNGFFHVDDIKPNKLPKTSSSQPLTGNGRTLEPCQAPIPLTLDSKGAGTSLKVDNKERKVNGIIEAQLLSVSPPKQLSSSAQASQIDEVSIRPPHPDLKYLSQVLSVPKMEQWSDFDDQSWLFHSIESQSKKPKVGFSEIDEPPQVWAEALQIESADVCALPYIIPY
ncbi:hypothetical protein E1A91_D02G028700v1 [Gossypium mustelinum]|uniref:Uncharacterized protein n=1 Tax=Gossypium mustelinum TaxID=34275 RepID=A0A5D2VRF0_GOSMU|nr:hypothetical protein E1A91_D02G028700v1 [Gossypium mustelinum]TYI91907.1 hypothetical protein E1A91_D02G028700v1 [Gossypium mustelinum]TYI91909.1 hypothetical protein E1A91_D02G028700v1 [Gossypium mustelinum]TYI91910.1 hypothetical protein E1A91_D02G028700v1 [Gossypium mustelinum]